MTQVDIKAKMVDLYSKICKAEGEEIKEVRSQMLALTSGNKSECMRILLSLDLTCGKISKILNVRYQFVNNVRAEMLRKKD